MYAPNVHTRIATLPGMWDRCVIGTHKNTHSAQHTGHTAHGAQHTEHTVHSAQHYRSQPALLHCTHNICRRSLTPRSTITLGSAGKSFSVTGHKVGWAVGPRPLIGAIASVRHTQTHTHHTTQLLTLVADDSMDHVLCALPTTGGHRRGLRGGAGAGLLGRTHRLVHRQARRPARRAERLPPPHPRRLTGLCVHTAIGFDLLSVLCVARVLCACVCVCVHESGGSES